MDDLTPYLRLLGRDVEVAIDRPLGSNHPRLGFRYEVNYGYVPGTMAGDDSEIDAYVLGEDAPLERFVGKCIAVIARVDDEEHKLVVANAEIKPQAIAATVNFVEQYYDTFTIHHFDALGTRNAEPADFDWLLALRQQTMDPHLTAAGMTPNMPAHIEAVEKDYDWTRIVTWHGEDVGMVKLIRTDPEWHLRQIQISPAWQGRGLGAAILAPLLCGASDAGRAIVLNVLRVNPAEKLYRRLGFEPVSESETSYKMRRPPLNMSADSA